MIGNSIAIRQQQTSGRDSVELLRDTDDALLATNVAIDEHANDNPSRVTSQRRVDHTYCDYSYFPSEELPTRKRAPSNFPSKLHQILSNPEYAHIISWMPHGRAWKIHNKELLIRDIVPKYFVQSKYESFTRQLNGWGFKRLHQSGNDFNAYYHECFLRGMPFLTVLLKRVAPNQGKLIPHVEGEPNFYEIDKRFPLPPHTLPSHPVGFHPYWSSFLYRNNSGSYHHLPTSMENPASALVRPFSFYPASNNYGQLHDLSASTVNAEAGGYPTSYHPMYETQYGFLPHEHHPQNIPPYPTHDHPQSSRTDSL